MASETRTTSGHDEIRTRVEEHDDSTFLEIVARTD